MLKPQIGRLPNGIDLSNSVENEFYCLKLAEACGLPVNKAEIQTFGQTKALVIERFDRQWTKDGRLLRIPQEDCCQALSVPPTRKYQSDGGPGLVQVLELFDGSDDPLTDQATIFRAQILFWLIGATDGHAKNFSLFLGPRGTYRLTPLYDILSAQPSLEAGQIKRKQMKLAMSLGTNRHYEFEEILPPHFVQTGKKASLPIRLIETAIAELTRVIPTAIDHVEETLPTDFPAAIHSAVKNGIRTRLHRLENAASDA